jgi:hypothetical protein
MNTKECTYKARIYVCLLGKKTYICIFLVSLSLGTDILLCLQLRRVTKHCVNIREASRMVQDGDVATRDKIYSLLFHGL